MGEDLATMRIFKDSEGKLRMESTCEKELDIEVYIVMLLKYIAGLIETEEVKIKIN